MAGTKTRRDEIVELRGQALGLLNTAKDRPLTESERSNLDGWRSKADELFAEQAAIDSQRTDLDLWEKRNLPGLEAPMVTRIAGNAPLVRTIGQQIVEAAGFQEYKARRMPYAVEIKVADLGGPGGPGGLSGGPGVQPLATPMTYPGMPALTDAFVSGATVATEAVFPWRVASLLGQGTTDGGAVPYMRLAGGFNTAAAVKPGAAKPVSGATPEFLWAPVITIAHIVIVPNQLLEDAPAFRTTVETKMFNGLVRAEDQQILNGTGANGQMLGILQTAGRAIAIAATAPAFADAVLQQYMAIYQATYIQPTGVVLAPDAFVNIATSKASTTGAYFLTGAPFDRSPAPLSVWGLPVAISPAIASKTGLVGAFATESILYRNGGIRVAISESHEDVFAKNATAIRVEERVALAIYTPAAFGEVTGIGAP